MAAALLLPLAAAAAASAVHWKETGGIKWCSDGRSPDWAGFPKDPFGAGVDGDCPKTPARWTLNASVAACEALCAPAAACVGFTWYPSAKLGGPPAKALSECCFRTGSVAGKPPCGGAQSCAATRCYEKPLPDRGPNISALVPSSVPLQSSLPIGVAAAAGVEFAPTAICQLLSGSTAATFPAEFVNHSFIKCHLPAGAASGSTTLAVANKLDPGVQGGAELGNALPLDIVPALTVAVGRRPYIEEAVGHVLISTAEFPRDMLPSGGARCAVTATLNASGAVLSNSSWEVTLGNPTIASLEFSLAPLPPSVQDSLQVSLHCAGGLSIVRYRQFQRFLPQPAAPRPPTVVQVDHRRRSVLVNGEPFLLAGWYYSLDDNANASLTDFVGAR